jgi:hypothetical protein
VNALTAAASADPQAIVLGLDAKLRPVVKARLGIPPQPRTYAVLRNGDATDFAGVDEVWRTPPR